LVTRCPCAYRLVPHSCGGSWNLRAGIRTGKFCLNADFHGTFRDLLRAANLQHGTHGFTSLLKEGALRIFPPLKIRRLRPGLNPRTWVPEASTLNPRPPKLLADSHVEGRKFSSVSGTESVPIFRVPLVPDSRAPHQCLPEDTDSHSLKHQRTFAH
jgi:hypothetical protein